MKNEKSTGSRAEYIEPEKSGQTIQKNVVQQRKPLDKTDLLCYTVGRD
jgi:hypothetical protein